MKSSFASATGNVKIFSRTFQAQVERARLVIAHGVGDHSDRYGTIVNAALPRGVSVWALDHRGHGRSRGRRGHVHSFDEYVTDLHTFVEKVRATSQNGAKVFLLGHNMGGTVALLYGARHALAIDGLIVSAPALQLAFKVPAWKRRLGSIVSALPIPILMDNGIDPRALSRNPAVVYTYAHDRLVQRKFTARWFTAFLAAMDRAAREVPRINVPVLIQAGLGDRIVALEPIWEVFSELNVTDKTLLTYPGCYHEIYNEPEPDRAKVIGDLLTWLEDHI